MKILLIKNVKSLGKIGKVKEVKDGYGKNFLVNKGLAKVAKPEVLENYKIEQANITKDKSRIKDNSLVITKLLEKFNIKITKDISLQGKLFGNITKVNNV